MVDTGYIPNDLDYEMRFGLVMNTGHMIHRRAYRRLWEDMLVLSNADVPLEVFLAAASSREEAIHMHHRYNASRNIT